MSGAGFRHGNIKNDSTSSFVEDLQEWRARSVPAEKWHTDARIARVLVSEYSEQSSNTQVSTSLRKTFFVRKKLCSRACATHFRHAIHQRVVEGAKKSGTGPSWS